MAISSMTGFARGESTADGCTWTWEVRSVNARGLEMRCRLPAGFEGLEPLVRQRVGTAIRRGNLLITLTLSFAVGSANVRVNEAVLAKILDLLPDIERRLPGAAPATASAILGLRGVIETDDGLPSGDARSRLEAELMTHFETVVAQLVAARQAEGARLQTVLEGQTERIAHLQGDAAALAATQPAAIFARLKEQLQALSASVPALGEDRLAQEAAMLTVKADPREELDRLNAHVFAARALLAAEGPVGRQLDFLCQELNREANTLCAKSADVELTRIGIDLKTVVDQLREQVQNIE